MGNGNSEKVTFTVGDLKQLQKTADGVESLNDKFDTFSESIASSVEKTGEIIQTMVTPLNTQQAECRKHLFPQVTKNKAWITILKWTISGGGTLGVILVILKIFKVF